MTLLQNIHNKLNNINNNIVTIIAQNTDEVTGEISPEVIDQLDKLQLSTEEITKVAGISYHQYKMLAEQVAAEKKRLNDLEKNYKSSMESFKKIMDKILGGDSFECESFAVKYRRSQSVEVDEDINMIDFYNEYPLLTDIKMSVLKNEVKKYQKDTGMLPQGVKIVDKQNMVIK